MYICESVRLLLLCLLVFYVDGMNSDLVHLLMQNRIRSELSVLIWHEFHFDTVSTLEDTHFDGMNMRINIIHFLSIQNFNIVSCFRKLLQF